MWRFRTTRTGLIITAVALLGSTVGLADVTPPASASVSAAAADSGPSIITVAGSRYGFGGDGGPATRAQLQAPASVVLDAGGNAYVADVSANRIRKVTPSGTITTVAGNGDCCEPHDGGPATAANLWGPNDVALDAAGNLYITEWGGRIRKVTFGSFCADPACAAMVSDPITTVAGGDQSGYEGDGGPATAAKLNAPHGVAFDAGGNLLFADSGNNVLRRVVPGADGVVTGAPDEAIETVAGGGDTTVYTGGSVSPVPVDGVPARLSTLYFPVDLALDGGALYIADTAFQRVRRVPAGADGVVNGGDDETITTVAGGGGVPGANTYGGDGGPATIAQLGDPQGLAFRHGDLYIADTSNNRVRRVAAGADGAVTGATDEVITTIAGDGQYADRGDGGPATAASIANPSGVVFDGVGNLFIAATGGSRVRLVGVLSLTTDDAPDPVPTGGPFTYRFRVGNFSSVRAADVRLIDALPDGAVIRSVSPSQGSCASGVATIRCDLGTVEASSQAVVVVALTAPGNPGRLVNRASLHATHPDPVLADNRDEERTVAAVPGIDVALADSPDPGQVGQPLVYTTTFTNRLPTDARGVTLTDTLPAQVSFRSATPSQGTCTQDRRKVTCRLGQVGYGGTATVQVAVVPTEPGGLVASATARASNFSSPVTASTATKVSAAGCGQVLTQSTTLLSDIGPCAGTGLVVGADGITLDLNGRQIFGFPGPADGHAAGVRLPMRTGVTVKNGTISGFDAGLFVNGGATNTLTRLDVRDNVGPRGDTVNTELGDGIYVLDSPGNLIADNVFSGNGVFDGIGIYGPLANGNVVRGNTVEDTVPPPNARDPFGQGIIVNGFSETLPQQTVPEARGVTSSDNVVADNVVRHNASAGISNSNHLHARVTGNVVEGNGVTQVNGNGIGVQLGPRALTVATFALIKGNQVHGNAWNGIILLRNAIGNTVVDNDAADNNTAANGSVDLHDDAEGCAGNVWNGNRWGSGGYDQECVTAGGSGPTPGAATSGPPPSTFPIGPLGLG